MPKCCKHVPIVINLFALLILAIIMPWFFYVFGTIFVCFFLPYIFVDNQFRKRARFTRCSCLKKFLAYLVCLAIGVPLLCAGTTLVAALAIVPYHCLIVVVIVQTLYQQCLKSKRVS